MGFGASPKNGRPHVTERFTAFQGASSNPDIPATCRHDVAIQAENTWILGIMMLNLLERILKMQFHVYSKNIYTSICYSKHHLKLPSFLTLR